MMKVPQKVLVTGNLGFIGSHLAKRLLASGHEVVGLDAETYAARPDEYSKLISITGVEKHEQHKVDIRNAEAVKKVIQDSKPGAIFHLAAESHVCNSIKGPALFYETNVMGTFNLLNAVKELDMDIPFLHVSTDEVFGELPLDKPEWKFNENSPIDPKTPYSSSKAASDMIVQAFHRTYGMKTYITNCSNNYGPNQHEEKLIPGTIQRILNQEKPKIFLPGTQVRDWLYVEDHAEALITVMKSERFGERFLVGGDSELDNLSMVKLIISILRDNFGISWPVEMHYVDVRPTDDLRYAINCTKMKSLGWKPNYDLHTNLRRTIEWHFKRGVK